MRSIISVEDTRRDWVERRGVYYPIRSHFDRHSAELRSNAGQHSQPRLQEEYQVGGTLFNSIDGSHDLREEVSLLDE
jgi:hypothetical protein